MSSVDPTQDEKIYVEELMDVSSDKQAELIADRFAEISNLYEPLKAENIQMPSQKDLKPVPLFEPHEIYEKIKSMRKKASTVLGDVPWRIISEYSVELCDPLSNIYNSATSLNLLHQYPRCIHQSV